MTLTDSTLPKARPQVEALAASAVATRRDLHAHAELSTEEHRTQSVILERLRSLGLDDVHGVADTGATALIRGTRPGPAILWRADIDGLPLTEETGLPFASATGAMHACGHDGHTAIALAMAQALHETRGKLAGSVRFAFQPAEERIGGAQRMIRAGIMEEPPVERVFGLHIWPQYPVGRVLVQPGPIFAAATHFRIIVRGRGGHAASPQEAVDPIVVSAHVITALQTVVSRAVDPAQTAVLTVGKIEGGVRGNIIPNEVMMSGTVRTYEPSVLERMLRRVEEVVSGVTGAWGATYQFDHSTLPACVNDAGCAAIVEAAASAFLGANAVGAARTTGADDMCWFLEAAPGAYFMLGARPTGAEEVFPHHHPRFDFDEACLPVGIELGLRIIELAAECDLS